MMKNSIVGYATLAVLLFTCLSGVESRFCNGIWKPQPGMPWMWQLSTTPSKADIDATNAQAVDLDLYTTSTDLIQYIQSKGKAMICYIDSQYEPGRPDSDQFTAAVKGKGIEGWPGQFWVDVRAQLVRDIMYKRAVLAQSKGCDAIEWDDVDGYANDNGFNLQYADQISFNTYLADITHNLGMSVGLKNDLDQVNDLVNKFDWALNEECVAHTECDVLQAFVKQNKAVFGTEYTGTASSFCPKQNTAKLSWLLSDLDLDGKGTVQCCTYASNGCAAVGYTCTPSNSTTPSTTSTGSVTKSPSPSSSPSSSPSTSPSTGATTSRGTTTGESDSGPGSSSESDSGNEAHADPSKSAASSVTISFVVASFLAIMFCL